MLNETQKTGFGF